MHPRRNKLIDLRIAFFVPVWRRVAVSCALVIWTVVESLYGNPAWAVLVGGLGLYTIYVFFFDFTVSTSRQKDDADP